MGFFAMNMAIPGMKVFHFWQQKIQFGISATNGKGTMNEHTSHITISLLLFYKKEEKKRKT